MGRVEPSGRPRADIHDGPEHMLQSEAGYINARPHPTTRRNLLATHGRTSAAKLAAIPAGESPANRDAMGRAARTMAPSSLQRINGAPHATAERFEQIPRNSRTRCNTDRRDRDGSVELARRRYCAWRRGWAFQSDPYRGASNLTGRSGSEPVKPRKTCPARNGLRDFWECRAAQISAKANVDIAALEFIDDRAPRGHRGRHARTECAA